MTQREMNEKKKQPSIVSSTDSVHYNLCIYAFDMDMKVYLLKIYYYFFNRKNACSFDVINVYLC